MPLTDTAIGSAKPQAKAVKLFDGGGLYMEVNPAGGKWWRWKYRFGGKEKRLALGVYPDLSLKAAREKRDAARQQLAAGIDPGQARRAENLAQAGVESFEAIAREWHEVFAGMGRQSRRPHPEAFREGPVPMDGEAPYRRDQGAGVARRPATI